MTFTEAAVEVLRLAGKPLHYKKITEIAIEKDLLSHVGKTPEITMSSRLATMVKKDRGDAPIVKIKPGVFGLREFSEDILEAAQDDSGHDFKLADVKESKKSEPAEDEGTESAETEEADTEAGDDEKKKKPARKLPGSDVFPEEDDDDEPILANLDDESKDGDEEGGKRGKRRRRRRRGRKEGEEEAAEAPEEPRSGRRSRRGGEQGRSRGRDRGGDRGRDQGRRGKSIPDGDWERLAAESDAVGSDLANAIEAALGGRGRQAKSYARIAESLVRKGRLSGEAGSLAPTIAAAVRSDGAAREALGLRLRFRMVEGGIALTNWGLPGEAVRAETDAIKAATRQRQQVLRAFIRQLGDLPAAGFMEILASWLNAEGVEGLRAVRRSGSNSQDFHLAGTLVRGPVRLPIALVVSRSGGNVNASRVVDVRGGLHHYGDAREAWIICLGQVSKDAREEAAGTGAAPVAIFDGLALATAMESRGIGIRRYSLPIVGLDDELLETLRGPGRATRVAPDEEKAEEKAEEKDSESASDENEAAEENATETHEEEEASEGTSEEVTPEGDSEDSSDSDASDAPDADDDDDDDDSSDEDDESDGDESDDDESDDDDDDTDISGAKSDDDDDEDDEKN